jgi:uncharacterized membrane protein YidH (DUF202 family)
MNDTDYILGTTHILIAILGVITCSLGIHAYNANDEYKNNHEGQFAILLILLILSVLIALVSIGTVAYRNRAEPAKALKANGFK